VLRFQQKFVDKMLSHSLRYGHVLYCMTNEIHPAIPHSKSRRYLRDDPTGRAILRRLAISVLPANSFGETPHYRNTYPPPGRLAVGPSTLDCTFSYGDCHLARTEPAMGI